MQCLQGMQVNSLFVLNAEKAVPPSSRAAEKAAKKQSSSKQSLEKRVRSGNITPTGHSKHGRCVA